MTRQAVASVNPASEFADYLANGEICLQHCTACGSAIFYPRNICPRCHGKSLVWKPISGGGTVYACTIINRKPEKGGPYNVILVDLDEGTRMMSRLESVEPEEVQIGQRVYLRIAQAADGPLIVCEPDETE